MKVLLSLGYFDDSGEGRLLGVDLSSGHTDVLVSYLPPEQLRVTARGFTGACLSEDRSMIYVCGHAAVFRVSTRTFGVDRILHIPSFNDLHHVAVREGRLYISNTGSDSVDVFSEGGRFIGSYMLSPPWLLADKMQGRVPAASLDVHDAGWQLDASAGTERLQSHTGAQQADDGYHTSQGLRSSTPYWRAKLPDRLHPNHCCPLAGQTLVTCLKDGSIRELESLRILYQAPGTYPHDGVAADGRFYFTTVDGRLWALPTSGGVLPPVVSDSARRWDVPAMSGIHGWCRGLLIHSSAGRQTAIVGFTEVRRGRVPAHRWCDRSPDGSRTGLVWLDLDTGDILARVDLSDPARHSKIYSILPWVEA
jgi:hypothetical protein